MIYDRSRTCHTADFRDPRGVWTPVHEPIRSLASSTDARGADVLRRDWDVYRDRRLAQPGGFRTPVRADNDRVSRRRQAFSEVARGAEAAELTALAACTDDTGEPHPPAVVAVWQAVARLERRIANAARDALHQLETGAHP